MSLSPSVCFLSAPESPLSYVSPLQMFWLLFTDELAKLQFPNPLQRHVSSITDIDPGLIFPIFKLYLESGPSVWQSTRAWTHKEESLTTNWIPQIRSLCSIYDGNICNCQGGIRGRLMHLISHISTSIEQGPYLEGHLGVCLQYLFQCRLT